MIFWAACECYQSAYPAVTEVRRCLEAFLNAAFMASSLGQLEGKLRYIPIVMPEGMHDRYPSRSLLRKKERIVDCAPQLDYEVFVNGNLEDRLREYLRGIAGSVPYLVELGATPEQIDDFNRIISTAVDRILQERPEQTRH